MPNRHIKALVSGSRVGMHRLTCLGQRYRGCTVIVFCDIGEVSLGRVGRLHKANQLRSGLHMTDPFGN
jgi:hypothetical protein